MARSTSSPAEGRRVKKRGVYFQAGNTDFRDARIGVDTLSANLMTYQLMLQHPITNPDTTHDNGEEDTFTAEVVFHANIGPNVAIISVGHSQGVDEHGKRLSYGSDVRIGDCPWIGAGVILLPGVEIGSHSIIGAGSVVTKDVLAFYLACGNLAWVLRKMGREVAKEPEYIITSLEEALEGPDGT